MGLTKMKASDPAPELDRVIHEPVRLRIMSLLAGVDTADFAFLRTALGLSKGNLSVHAARLEVSGYIEITKTFEGKLPKTRYRMTQPGRRALERYWESLDAIRGALNGHE